MLGTNICVPASHRRAIHQRGRSFPTAVMLTQSFLLCASAILLALMTLTKYDWMFLCYFSIQFYSLLRKCIYCVKWYFHMHVLGVRVTFDISKHSALACCTQLALLGHVSALETLAWGWSTWHLYFINLVPTAPSKNHQSDICTSLLSMCVCVRTRIDFCNTDMWSATRSTRKHSHIFPLFFSVFFP